MTEDVESFTRENGVQSANQPIGPLKRSQEFGPPMIASSVAMVAGAIFFLAGIIWGFVARPTDDGVSAISTMIYGIALHIAGLVGLVVCVVKCFAASTGSPE